MKTREEIRKQWIYDCTVACDNATARLKELEENKPLPLSEEEIDTACVSIAHKYPDLPYQIFRDTADKVIEMINRKNNE